MHLKLLIFLNLKNRMAIMDINFGMKHEILPKNEINGFKSSDPPSPPSLHRKEKSAKILQKKYQEKCYSETGLNTTFKKC